MGKKKWGEGQKKTQKWTHKKVFGKKIFKKRKIT